MPRKGSLKLSGRVVNGLRVQGKDAVFWDREVPGFGVRVYPSGRKVYVVQTRGPDGLRRVSLGRHGEIPADRARRQALAVIDRIRNGESPDSAPAGPALTVADLAKRYMEAHVAVSCNAHTRGIYQGSLDNHILPALGTMALDAVGPSEAAALHYALRATPRAANRALMVLSKMFALAEAWGLAPAGGNPCRFVRKYKEGKRERFLSSKEYRRVGRALRRLEVEGPGAGPVRAAAALKLLMLTGCRVGEILSLKWDDVDRKAGELRLRDTKTGARMVSLTPAGAAVIAEVVRVPGKPLGVRGTHAGPAPVAAHHVLALGAGTGRGGRRADPRPPPLLRLTRPRRRGEPFHDRPPARARRCREHRALRTSHAGRGEGRGGQGGREHRGGHSAPGDRGRFAARRDHIGDGRLS